MNKLAEFPLAEAGYATASDNTVIVGFGNWNLTVGDVRTARQLLSATEHISQSVVSDLACKHGTRNESSPDYHRPYFTFEVTELHDFARDILSCASTAASEQQASVSEADELGRTAAAMRQARDTLDDAQARKPGSKEHIEAANRYQGALAALTKAALSGRATIPSEADERHRLLNEIESYFEANANISDDCADFLDRLVKLRRTALTPCATTATPARGDSNDF